MESSFPTRPFRGGATHASMTKGRATTEARHSKPLSPDGRMKSSSPEACSQLFSRPNQAMATTCARCGTEGKAPEGKTPRGWKRDGDSVICRACHKSAYILRAVTIPIASPVSRGGEPAGWAEFRADLFAAWQASTQISNWAVRELAKADVVRGPGDEKLPRFKAPYLYPGARALRPDMAPTSVASLLNAVSSKYGKSRVETIWRNDASLPNARYPQPIPIHNQSWSALRSPDGATFLTFPLLAGAEARWVVRLRGGKGQRRALAAVTKLLRGEARQCELAIYRVRAQESDHRPGVVAREPGGKAKVKFDIMAKLVLWLPRPKADAPKEERKLVLRTTAESFWLAEIEDLPPWIVNADHVRRWIAAHRSRLQRLSEDRKREKRWPAHMRAQMQDRTDALCHKQHNRMKSWNQEVSASLAKYAKRNKVTVVNYCDDCHEYVESYPWFQLKEVLKNKLDEFGIRFEESSSAPVVDETQEPLEV